MFDKSSQLRLTIVAIKTAPEAINAIPIGIDAPDKARIIPNPSKAIPAIVAIVTSEFLVSSSRLFHIALKE